MNLSPLLSKSFLPACIFTGMGFIFCQQLQAQGLYVGSNSNLISNGAVNIILNNTGLNNQGSFINNGNTVIFTGNAAATASAIKGINVVFNNLTINKSAGDVRLYTGIAVNGNLSFAGGNLQLNNYNVDLGSGAGTLSGENEDNHINGVGGGMVLKTALLNNPAAANPGNIGVYITSPANLGSTLIKRGNKPQTVAAGKSGIGRYFEFAPANTLNNNVSLQFNYFDAELNGLAEDDLFFWSSSNAGNTWSYLGKDGNSGSQNFVLKNSINQPGRFTLAASNTSSLTAKTQLIADVNIQAVMGKIYPNPAKDYVNIEFTALAKKELTIGMYAQTGQLLELKKVQAVKGLNTLYWRLQQYAAGVYYFKFDNISIPSALIVKQY